MHSIQKFSCNFNAFGMGTLLHIFIHVYLVVGIKVHILQRPMIPYHQNKNNHIAKKTMPQTNCETIHAYPPSNMVVNFWEQ
jgi:hypothetical protein